MAYPKIYRFALKRRCETYDPKIKMNWRPLSKPIREFINEYLFFRSWKYLDIFK